MLNIQIYITTIINFIIIKTVFCQDDKLVCPPGTVLENGQTEYYGLLDKCVFCAEGYFAEKPGQCKQCSIGLWSQRADKSIVKTEEQQCKYCDYGYFYDGKICKICSNGLSPGTHQLKLIKQEESQVCTHCLPGTYSEAQNKCNKKCGNGRRGDKPTEVSLSYDMYNACTIKCDISEWSTPEAGTKCDLCNEGYYPKENNYCEQCPYNKWSQHSFKATKQDDKIICNFCQDGFFSPDGKVCIPCPAGSIGNGERPLDNDAAAQRKACRVCGLYEDAEEGSPSTFGCIILSQNKFLLKFVFNLIMIYLL